MAPFVAQRLTLIREKRGLTKEGLADLCGVSRRAVSDWEAARVSSPPVDMLATVLNVENSFFFVNDSSPIRPNEVSFRALTSMSARSQRQAVATATFAVELSRWIDERFEAPSDGVPRLDDLGISYPGDRADSVSPREAAMAVRDYWNLGGRPVANAIRLLETHGARLFNLGPADRSVDAFSYWRADRAYLLLNIDKSWERVRFDIAHELGHLVLHRGVETVRKREFELEANAFASEFLMPTEAFLRQVGSASSDVTLDDVYILKRSWKVSLAAVVKRLMDLELIPDWRYRMWMRDISAKGFRRSEPEGLSPERSELLTQILARSRRAGTGIAQVATQSGVPRDVLEELLVGLTVMPLSQPMAATQEEAPWMVSRA